MILGNLLGQIPLQLRHDPTSSDSPQGYATKEYGAPT